MIQILQHNRESPAPHVINSSLAQEPTPNFKKPLAVVEDISVVSGTPSAIAPVYLQNFLQEKYSDMLSNNSRKKQVRFTNVYDAQNLTSMKNMRNERMAEFDRILDERK